MQIFLGCPLLPPCTAKCAEKCSEKFSQRARKSIRRNFWKKDLRGRREFMKSTVQILHNKEQNEKKDGQIKFHIARSVFN